MSSCSKCQLTFDRGKKVDVKITCDFCEKEFHPKCVNMTIANFEFINNSRNTSWLCDNCSASKTMKNVLLNCFVGRKSE